MRTQVLLKSCLAASAALSLTAPAQAQRSSNTAIITNPAQTQAERNWAEKMFSEMRLEMGTVARGTKINKQLTVTNLYKEDIKITSVGTTCGCFHAETDKKVLKTHESATITVDMNTIKFQGDRKANLDVTLTFDGSTYKSVRIPLHGFIRTDVEIQPGVLNLGMVEQGRGATKAVTVKFTGRPGWQIRQVRSNNPLLKTEVRDRFRDNYRVEADVVVTLDASAPLGDVRDLLTIVTNDSSNPELQVEVAGKVEPDLIVTPAAIPLGNLRPGVEKTVSVVIRGQRPFAIEALERDTSIDCWKCKYSRETKVVHPITLTMTPPADMAGEYSEVFTVSVQGREEPLTFKATGTIVGTTPLAADK
ncbi:MAG: DUF1573 domain-containing protein [Planctomyces sp.]|nr:DUF1573 domain-containing protein [Planctomyces sp.]